MKGQANARSWPPIHVEALERLWRAGKTASEIAEEIPYSRAAICAMARRQDLPARPRAVVPKAKPIPAPRQLSIARRVENMIALVSDNTPLRAAAELADVPFAEGRRYFNWMLSNYDMGEPATMTDDVVRPVRA